MIYETEPQSNQEVFDRVWNTFVTEGKPRAVSVGSCKYRITPVDGEEHGCAIGCQLPAKLYNADYEGAGAYELFGLTETLWPKVEPETQMNLRFHFRYVSFELLRQLQVAHDGARASDDLRLRLVALAGKWHLTVPA